MTKIDSDAEKAQRNAEYAARFPRRSRTTIRDARRERVLARETAWLARHGIARNMEHPLA